MIDGRQPLMLGLIGDSASGKTTLARGVVRILGHNGVTPVCLDDYHRFSRAERVARGLTDAHPAATDLELMARHLSMLRAGGTIRKPVYDHALGLLRGPETVAATGLVLAYGLLTLTPPSLASLFDLTIYLEPDAPLRQVWRLERDVQERGYTPEEVLARRAVRERDAATYVAIQRPHADIVLRFHGSPGGSPAGLSAEMLLRYRRGPGPLAAAIERLAVSAPPGLTVERGVTDDDGCAADRLAVDAAIDPEAARAVAALLGDGVSGVSPATFDQIGQVRRAEQTIQNRALALTQLLIVRRLLGVDG